MKASPDEKGCVWNSGNGSHGVVFERGLHVRILMASLGERRSRRRDRLCCASLCPHEREPLVLCGGLKRASGAMTVAKARPVVRSMPNAGRRPSVPRSTATDCAGSRPEPCWAMTDRGRHLVAETSFGTGRHASPLHLAPGTVVSAACLMYSRML